MSYARSPRPLCSITIGIKPSPFGSSFQPLLIVRAPAWLTHCPLHLTVARARSSRRRLHQRRESCRLILDPCALQYPLDHIAFDRTHLVFVQPVGLLIMPPDHRFRQFETLGGFLDQHPDLLRSRLQLVLPDDLVQDQAERHAFLGLRSERIRRQLELLGLDATVLERSE